MERALFERGEEARFERLAASPDPRTPKLERTGHLTATLVFPSRTIELYVYECEAGFKASHNWFVFERHQYHDAGALIAAFVEGVCEWLP